MKFFEFEKIIKLIFFFDSTIIKKIKTSFLIKIGFKKKLKFSYKFRHFQNDFQIFNANNVIFSIIYYNISKKKDFLTVFFQNYCY